MIFARLKLWAAGIGLVIAALAASWLGGRNAAKTAIKAKELESYVKTRERMDDVARLPDADAARMFLAKRGKQKSDL